MNARARFTARFAAHDPARARFAAAISVSFSVVVSALTASIVLNAMHAGTSLMAMSVFLSVQTGSMVKDRTTIARIVTTTLLIPSVVLAICLATLLSAYRPALIAVFIIVTGGAIWVRRFGPRAAAIGSLCFMGFFFTLFMKVTAKELPLFCLIAAIAVAAQLLGHAILLLKRPRRQLTVLLREFRIASAAAIQATRHAERATKRRAGLARIDEIARAITSWQQEFRTDHVVNCDEQTLDARVLEARVNTEEACIAFAEVPRSHRSQSDPTLQHALAQLATVLNDHATSAQIEHATAWADQTLTLTDGDRVIHRWEQQAARALIAHASLRKIDLSHGMERQLVPSGSPAPAPGTSPASLPVAGHEVDTPRHTRWLRWSQWAPTSRMAVQAMVAAAIAAGVGEAISASRWYWAVITVFVIFGGATTRSGILTKAFRRVAGTAAGVGIGVIAITLIGDNTVLLVAVCVVAIFGMLYFGPLNYAYSPLFITVMLVCIYRMLGILDQSILELRIVETASGAAIGVLCAYLIMTTNSRPALVAQVDTYFDALDDLLRKISGALGKDGKGDEIAAGLHRLETSQANVDQSLSAMSTAFLVGGPHRESEAVHLMYIATRAAAKLTQSMSSLTEQPAPSARGEATSHTVSNAIDTVLMSSTVAHLTLCSPDQLRTLSAGQQTERPNVLSSLDQLPAGAASPSANAIMALARIDWALHQISEQTTVRG